MKQPRRLFLPEGEARIAQDKSAGADAVLGPEFNTIFRPGRTVRNPFNCDFNSNQSFNSRAFALVLLPHTRTPTSARPPMRYHGLQNHSQFPAEPVHVRRCLAV